MNQVHTAIEYSTASNRGARKHNPVQVTFCKQNYLQIKQAITHNLIPLGT